MTQDPFTAQSLQFLIWSSRNYPEATFLSPPKILKIQRERTKTVKGGQEHIVRPAAIVIEIPDELAARLKSENNRDVILVGHIREEVLDRVQSGIVLPGEEQH